MKQFIFNVLLFILFSTTRSFVTQKYCELRKLYILIFMPNLIYGKYNQSRVQHTSYLIKVIWIQCKKGSLQKKIHNFFFHIDAIAC